MFFLMHCNNLISFWTHACSPSLRTKQRKTKQKSVFKFIQYKNRSNKGSILDHNNARIELLSIDWRPRVFNGKKAAKTYVKKMGKKLNCYVTFSANHVFYWNMLRMNFWNYSTFHNLVALQEPRHWVDNSSREKEGTHQTAFGQPQIIWRQHLWDRPVFFPVVTASFFLGKVFVCLLKSVFVRPTEVLLSSGGWTEGGT